jgi:acyl-CoA thioester hydrolase
MTLGEHRGHLSYKGLVYPWHCDHMGHMNVMWYVSKFDEAVWAFFMTIGLTPDYLKAHDHGMAALEQKISYHREAVAGDLLEIYVRPLEVSNKTIRLFQEMIDVPSGEVAATNVSVAVHLDKIARKGIALPDDVREAALALI